jgi:hypothetical protein
MERPRREFCEWAARKLLADLRTGRVPDELQVEDFSFYPMTDYLWAEMGTEDGDKDLLLNLLDNPNTEGWGSLLWRGFPDDPDVEKCILRWLRMPRYPDDSYYAFHDLAYRDISEETRRELTQWLSENQELYQRKELEYFGGPQVVVAKCRERMADPKFQKKRWVYILTALGAGDQKKVAEFLSDYVSDEDAFVAGLARRALEHLERNGSVSFQEILSGVMAE